MQDLFETIRRRHRIRSYRSDAPLEREKLDTVLEAACTAPSAGDLRACHITVVRNRELRHELADAASHRPLIAQAPAVLTFSAAPVRSATRFGERGANLYALQDATIAAAYAQLAATAVGLASTWVGDFDERRVKEILGLDADLVPVTLLAVGYPTEAGTPSPRCHLEEMISWK